VLIIGTYASKGERTAKNLNQDIYSLLIENSLNQPYQLNQKRFFSAATNKAAA